MLRSATVLALSTALLAPVPAFAQESATPTAGMSPSPESSHDYCGPGHPRDLPTLTTSAQTITAGDPVTVSLRIPGPYNRVHANINGYTWTSPTQREFFGLAPGGPASSGNGSGPFAPGETATRTVTIEPVGNTRVFWNGALYCGSGPFHGDVFSANPAIINVAPRLTLTAVRNAPRDYTFSGVATTPGLILNLYRVDADGSMVLTSQTRATGDRTWAINRKFLGAGRFGFVVLTGRTMANAPGQSNTRPTVIH